MAARRSPAPARPRPSTAAFEASASGSGSDDEQRYVLRLFVAGTTPGSVRAVENLRKICEELLAGRYDLEVIDVYQDPAMARDEQVIAVPTLVKKLPIPLRRILGDLSDREQVLVGLDLKTTADDKKPQTHKRPTQRR